MEPTDNFIKKMGSMGRKIQTFWRQITNEFRQIALTQTDILCQEERLTDYLSEIDRQTICGE